jgi:hypothetical protein
VPRSSGVGVVTAEQMSLLYRKEVSIWQPTPSTENTGSRQPIQHRQQKKLLDAVEANKEEDFHISDSVRESDEEAGTDKPAGIGTILKRQITGK